MAMQPEDDAEEYKDLDNDSFQPPGASDNPQQDLKPLVEKINAKMQYRLVRLIGAGGQGEVWEGEDLVLGRKVAVKISRWPKSFQQRDRFEREATITAMLEHPGIVPVVARGTVTITKKGVAHDYPYYVMRYVQGERLSDLVRKLHSYIRDEREFSLPDRQLIFYRLLQRFVAVCHVIAYAHSRGVIHRDLKPNNIILGYYGETFVLDWGLARRLATPDSNYSDPTNPGPSAGALLQAIAQHHDRIDNEITKAGYVLGTPAYMAPEQLAGHRGTYQTDVFLLGATLYHLLTGRPPFADSKDGGERRQPVPPKSVKTWVPRSLDYICLKAMAYMPKDRYTSAKELAAVVEEFLAAPHYDQR
jgi:serine/threonine protein kinase